MMPGYISALLKVFIASFFCLVNSLKEVARYGHATATSVGLEFNPLTHTTHSVTIIQNTYSLSLAMLTHSGPNWHAFMQYMMAMSASYNSDNNDKSGLSPASSKGVCTKDHQLVVTNPHHAPTTIWWMAVLIHLIQSCQQMLVRQNALKILYFWFQNLWRTV